MFKTRKFIPAFAVALLGGLAVAGCSAGASEVVPGTETVRCEIDVTSTGGAIGLGAVVHADQAVTGTYRFNVSGSGSSGSTNISQGGAFSAGPGDDARLGRLMLGNRGAVYDVSLDISVGGADYRCTDRVGGV